MSGFTSQNDQVDLSSLFEDVPKQLLHPSFLHGILGLIFLGVSLLGVRGVFGVLSPLGGIGLCFLLLNLFLGEQRNISISL